MMISIVTVVYNRVATIGRAIESVINQTYSPVEYIIVDGNSTDGTQEVIGSYGNAISKFISEPDNGIYDALNKAIKMASGEVVGVLHSDDVFASTTIIEQMASAFALDTAVDAVYGDVAFVHASSPAKVKRYFSSGKFHPALFKRGYMPAHPSFFCRLSLFNKFGYYRTDMKIAADFELLIRFIYKHQINCRYISVCTTVMTTGGASTGGLKSNITINREFLQALKVHGIPSSYLHLYSRYLNKWKEFFKRK